MTPRSKLIGAAALKYERIWKRLIESLPPETAIKIRSELLMSLNSLIALPTGLDRSLGIFILLSNDLNFLSVLGKYL